MHSCSYKCAPSLEERLPLAMAVRWMCLVWLVMCLVGVQTEMLDDLTASARGRRVHFRWSYEEGRSLQPETVEIHCSRQVCDSSTQESDSTSSREGARSGCDVESCGTMAVPGKDGGVVFPSQACAAVCDDSCTYSLDGLCDDTQGSATAICPLGSDCADCGLRFFPQRLSPNGAQFDQEDLGNCLVNQQVYTFNVTAYQEDGTSVSRMQTITPVGPPMRPRDLQGIRANRTACLTWKPPLASGGAHVLNYVVNISMEVGGYSWNEAKVLAGVLTFDPFSNSNVWIPPQTFFLMRNLQDGVAYSFTVVADNGSEDGTSPPSLPVDMQVSGNDDDMDTEETSVLLDLARQFCSFGGQQINMGELNQDGRDRRPPIPV